MKKAIILILLITFYFVSTAQDEWTLIHPYPTLETLTDVHFINNNKGWVMSYYSILTTEDGGDTWETQLSSNDDFFRRLFFIDENEGWALGWEYIYHTTNAGNTWEQQSLPSHTGELNDVFFLNNDIGWIVGGYKIVMKTTDGGNTWTKIMNTYAGDIRFQSVIFFDELNGCVVGHQNGLRNSITMVTDDGGLTWIETTPPDHDGLTKIILKDSLIGWACGYSGELLTTPNRGKTWIDKSNIYYSSIKDICFFDDNNGVFMESNSLRLTFDGGENWDSIVPIGVSTGQRSISNWDYNKLVAVGAAGSISKSLDGGSSWQRVSKGLIENIYQLGFFNSLDGFGITNNWTDGDLIRTTDGGYNWSFDTLVENGSFYRMYIQGSSCFLLNDSSQLMKTTNSGIEWDLMDVPDITSYYYDMKFVNDNTGYLCGNDGFLVKTVDGGHTWIDKSLDDDYSLRSMFLLDENYGWILDNETRIILRTSDGGDNWNFAFLGDVYYFQPTSVFFIDENEGFATTREGVIFKSINSGESWEEFYVFPSGIDSEIYFIDDLEGWYRAGGGVYHTFNGGLSWVNRQGIGSSIKSMFFLKNEHPGLGWLGGNYGLVATTNFTVDIDEVIDNQASVSVFPNPAHETIEVTLKDKSEFINDVNVFDMQGKQILHFANLSTNHMFKFDVSDLNPGIYIIHVISANNENLIKFIVQ